jgi:signal transduction histidine kinase
VTSEGVSVLKPDAAQKQVLPLVSITSVSIMGKADSLALLHGMHRYSYTSNSIGFSFAGASFLDEKRLLYRYMLEGYDKTWGEPVSSPTVNYVSLPPGKYVFRVKAANSRGQWSAASADYPFEIVMPFYRRPVFFFFVFTVLVFILYMIRFQQLKQRYRIEKLRFHIARDLHDDIGSTLGSINILSQTARRRLDKQLPAEEISPIFHTIGKSAENTLEAMDDIVWSINPGKDKVEDLLIRIREFAIPLLEGKGLDFQISFEGNDHEPLPMDLRRNVFLICKEAVYNVLRHSEASHVQVLLKRSHHHLILKVEDNGSGFDVHAASSRNGLKNMQNRAALVNGVLTIHSSEAGTRILFEAPIK